MARPPSPQPIPGFPGARVLDRTRRAAPLSDMYHAFLRAPWWGALAAIVVVYLLLNAVFAVAFLMSGGVAGAHPGSFTDAFFFSVQTMGTVGYGAMYPASRAANYVVVAESVTGLIVTALATGLVFTKFSQSTARVVFTSKVAIAPMDGVPTLMFRVGNERSNRILEAVVRVVMIRTEITKEGMRFYRMVDMPLSRDRSPAMSRSWTALHPITPTSPLYKQSPGSLKASEAELLVTLVGTDETSLQPVHAQKRYEDHEIIWGARHADVITEDADGQITVDLRKFHDLVPTEPTTDFPYP